MFQLFFLLKFCCSSSLLRCFSFSYSSTYVVPPLSSDVSVFLTPQLMLSLLRCFSFSSSSTFAVFPPSSDVSVFLPPHLLLFFLHPQMFQFFFLLNLCCFSSILRCFRFFSSSTFAVPPPSVDVSTLLPPLLMLSFLPPQMFQFFFHLKLCCASSLLRCFSFSFTSTYVVPPPSSDVSVFLPPHLMLSHLPPQMFQFFFHLNVCCPSSLLRCFSFSSTSTYAVPPPSSAVSVFIPPQLMTFLLPPKIFQVFFLLNFCCSSYLLRCFSFSSSSANAVLLPPQMFQFFFLLNFCCTFFLLRCFSFSSSSTYAVPPPSSDVSVFHSP
jgi:hypothetical protein